MKGQAAYGPYVVALLGVLLGLFALSWVYTTVARPKFLPIEYGPWKAQLQMIRACDVGEVAVLGDSRASAAYMPRFMGVHAKNFALTGSTPIEGYYEAAEILKCPHPPKLFVLSYSSYHFQNMSWFWERSARYGLLDFDELQEIARAAKATHDTDLYHGAFGSEPPPTMKNWLYAKHFPPFDFASLLAAHGGLRGRENARMTEETLAGEGEHLLGQGRCATGPAWEASQTAFTPSPLLVTYFERLTGLLRAHDAKALLIAVPISRPTYERLNPAYQARYGRFLAAQARQDPEIRIVGPLFPTLADCQFSDANHLNGDGAEAFSRAVGPQILAAVSAWGASPETAAVPPASAAH